MDQRKAIAGHLAEMVDALVKALESAKAAIAFWAETPAYGPGPITGPTPEQLGYLTIPEAAKRLRVSPHTLYNLCQPYRAHLKFPAVRIGNRVQIDAAKLDAWLAGGGEALFAKDQLTGRRRFPDPPVTEKPRPVHSDWRYRKNPPPPPPLSKPGPRHQTPSRPPNAVVKLLMDTAELLTSISKAHDAMTDKAKQDAVFKAYDEMLQAGLQLQQGAIEGMAPLSLKARLRLTLRKLHALRELAKGDRALADAINALHKAWVPDLVAAVNHLARRTS